MAIAIVLAAGEGSRLGGPKALVEVAGRPMVAWAVETCRQALVQEVVVVTGAGSAAVAEAIAAIPEGDPEAHAPVRVVTNERWRDGKTGSLQCGWRAVEPAATALVHPVDHPAVRLVTLDVLLGVYGYAAAQPEALVPVLQEGGERRRGHPIVLHGRLREKVLELGPDDPLNAFVRAREALEVPVDDEAILLNVNEPADVDRATARLAGR